MTAPLTSPRPAPVAPRAAASAEPLTTRVLDSFSDAKPFRSAWEDLVVRSGTDIYQTYDWCRIWWEHYGARRRLQLLLCFSGEELVGVVPAFVETLWLGPARVRVAKLAGSDFSLQLCNLPVLPDALPQVVTRALDHFLGSQRCDLLLLGPLSGPSARTEEICATAQAASDLVQCVESLGNSCTTRFDLPDSFDAYLNLVGTRQRGNYLRSVNQFSKAHRVTTDVVSEPDELRAEFDRFVTFHELQWREEGKLGHFGDWPRSVGFNRKLVEDLPAQGRVRFFRIFADGEIASSQFCFIHAGVNYWRLPARACNPAWAKLSLGKMGLVKMVEDSLRDGIRAIEGGRGHYDYKVQLGGREWPSRTLQVMRHAPGVAARVRLFRSLASWLNIAYYKVVFARLAPRVPAFRGSLWPVWIRSTW